MLPYVVASIETGVPWPAAEEKVSFCDSTLTLVPETTDRAPAVVLALAPPMDEEQGIRLLKRFLTALAWVHRQPVRELMTAPQVNPLPVGKRPTSGATTYHFHEDYLPCPEDDRAAFALALYRQAVGLNDAAYECLAYFRIMQVVYRGEALRHWFDAALTSLADYEARQRLPALAAAAAAVQHTPGAYLYGLRRCALAHGNPDDPVNPDKRGDMRLLAHELPVLRALAEQVIESDLGIPSARAWRNKRRAAEQGVGADEPQL